MDLATLTWLPPGTAQDLPSPRAGAGTAPLGTRVVLSGGEGHGAAWQTVSALDITTGTWTALPPLTDARHGTGLVSCGGVLTTAAGAGAQAGGVYRTTTEVYSEVGGGARACADADVPGVPPPLAGGLPPAAPQPTATPAASPTATAAPADPPRTPSAAPAVPTAAPPSARTRPPRPPGPRRPTRRRPPPTRPPASPPPRR